MPEKILITGGCRSGKSRYALDRAGTLSGEKFYLATAEALDSEMENRIARHRQERGAEWETHEEPVELIRVLKNLEKRSGILVVDCLTLWISNLLLRDFDSSMILKETGRLLDQSDNLQCHIIFVTNEVGAGIVPDNPLARKFRDIAGSVNQSMAQRCDEVIHMVAGIPTTIKPS